MEAELNSPLGRTVLGSIVITIGRAADNQVVMSDPKASSHHAEIRPEEQGYSLTDLGSTNGTFVNDQRMEHNVPQLLRPHDTIRIGDIAFTYEASTPPQADPTVYTNESSSDAPRAGYQPTIAAPSPYTAYNSPGEQAYQPPPPSYDYGSSSYAPSQEQYSPSAGAIPPMYAPPKSSSNRRVLWIVLAVVGGVLLLSCIVCSLVLFVSRSTPTHTLTTFCDALKRQDYPTAYDQLSSGFQSRMSEGKFASTLAQGGLSDCSFTSPNESNSIATTTMTWKLNIRSLPFTFNCQLVDENGTWKISTLESPSTQ